MSELTAGGKGSLRRFFDDLVWKHFFDDVRLEEPGVTQSVSKMLVDFVDFVQAGKESYAIVSSFDQFEYRDEAPLFRSLSENFETCVVGLNFVKQDLEEFQREYYQRVKEILGKSKRQ